MVTEAQARESDMRGVLTRCIGTHQSVKVDTLILDLFPGDRLLMCTDGLHQYLAGRDLLDLLGPEGGDVGKLVAHANAAGGADNISFVAPDRVQRLAPRRRRPYPRRRSRPCNRRPAPAGPRDPSLCASTPSAACP